MSVSVVSARLPTGDTPVCNVTLEPYVLIKRGDTTVTADDVPPEGSPEPGLQLRSRWYRSSLPRGGAVCSVHPEREASVQCTVCLRCKVAVHLSFHCSAECFRSSWQQHREYHRTAHANGVGRSVQGSAAQCAALGSFALAALTLLPPALSLAFADMCLPCCLLHHTATATVLPCLQAKIMEHWMAIRPPRQPL